MAPRWIVIMDAAEEWKMKPWEVDGTNKTLWFARFEAVQEARGKKAAKQRMEMEARK